MPRLLLLPLFVFSAILNIPLAGQADAFDDPALEKAKALVAAKNAVENAERTLRMEEENVTNHSADHVNARRELEQNEAGLQAAINVAKSKVDDLQKAMDGLKSDYDAAALKYVMDPNDANKNAAQEALKKLNAAAKPDPTSVIVAEKELTTAQTKVSNAGKIYDTTVLRRNTARANVTKLQKAYDAELKKVKGVAAAIGSQPKAQSTSSVDGGDVKSKVIALITGDSKVDNFDDNAPETAKEFAKIYDKFADDTSSRTLNEVFDELLKERNKVIADLPTQSSKDSWQSFFNLMKRKGDKDAVLAHLSGVTDRAAYQKTYKEIAAGLRAYATADEELSKKIAEAKIDALAAFLSNQQQQDSATPGGVRKKRRRRGGLIPMFFEILLGVEE